MSFTLWWKPPLLGTDLSCAPARPGRVGRLLETRRHCFPDIILQLKSEASNLWPIGRRESTTVLISVIRTPSWCVHREDRAPDAPRSWYGSSSVRGGGRGYRFGGPPFAYISPRLSLFSDHLRTVLAVKGS